MLAALLCPYACQAPVGVRGADQVVGVEPTHPVRVGGGVHHPCAPQLLPQQGGQQVRRQVVALDRRLEAVDRQLVPAGHAAGVVRQHVDRRVRPGQVRGQRPDLVQPFEVGPERARFAAVTGGPDQIDGGGEPIPVAAHHDHVVTAAGELLRGGQAHSGTGAGDDDRAVLHAYPHLLDRPGRRCSDATGRGLAPGARPWQPPGIPATAPAAGRSARGRGEILRTSGADPPGDPASRSAADPLLEDRLLGGGVAMCATVPRRCCVFVGGEVYCHQWLERVFDNVERPC